MPVCVRLFCHFLQKGLPDAAAGMRAGPSAGEAVFTDVTPRGSDRSAQDGERRPEKEPDIHEVWEHSEDSHGSERPELHP